jgi:hypothetical protein
VEINLINPDIFGMVTPNIEFHEGLPGFPGIGGDGGDPGIGGLQPGTDTRYLSGDSGDPGPKGDNGVGGKRGNFYLNLG